MTTKVIEQGSTVQVIVTDDTGGGGSLAWSDITGKPTTLAGYGIADAQPLDGDLTALGSLTGTNTIYYRSGLNTWSPVTIGANLAFASGELSATGGGGGSGTVTTVSVANANGVSGTVANASTTPAITLTLGAITPSSVAASGTVTGSNLSGTNTGNQTIAGLTGNPTAAALSAALNSTIAPTYANVTGKPTLGTASTANTGVSGHTVPYLDIANTWSASQAFSEGLSVAAGKSLTLGISNAFLTATSGTNAAVSLGLGGTGSLLYDAVGNVGYLNVGSAVPLMWSASTAKSFGSPLLTTMDNAGDSGPTMSAAATTAGPKGAILLGNRTYTINTQPDVYGPTVLGLGATLAGTNGIPGATDYGQAKAAGILLSRFQINQGTNGVVGSANESAIYLSSYLNATPTSGGLITASYQKNVAAITMLQGDASQYSSPGSGTAAAVVTSARDGVGLDIQVGMAAGVTNGRVFGLNIINTVPSGTNSTMCLMEGKVVDNSGTYQPYFATSTTKHGWNLFVDGTTPIRTGIYLDKAEAGSAANFTDAIFVTQQSVGTNLIHMRANNLDAATVQYQVDRNGRTFMGNTTAPSTPAAGIIAYSESGVPKIKDPAGNVVVLAQVDYPLNFTAAADAYIPAAQAMTISQGNAMIGTGTLAYAKSTSAAPSTFASTTLPTTLEAGAWLKVTASGVTGFLAQHLKRTA